MSALAVLLALASSAVAAPSINLPINAQVPPVAIANQAYNFVFSAFTFTTTAPPLSYALADNPSWIQLDNSNRTLYGTPGSDAAGSGQDESFNVDLIATDGTGSTTMPVTLVVTTDPGLGLGTPVAAQLPGFGAFSSPATLLLTPGNALSLTFSPNTFTNTNENTLHYAMCADNTPLPSWVHFDPTSLTFSGITPQATSPSELPQTYGIQLIASQVPGFAQAVASFELVLESHMFAFENSLQIIDATIGSPVNFTGLQHDLTLDGRPTEPSDISQIGGNVPSWLSMANGTLALSGTPPPSTVQQNFTVTAMDKFGDTASTSILIQIVGNSSVALIGPIPPLNATVGTDFTYWLNASLPPVDDMNIIFDAGTASAWLDFNSSSLELYGHVPTNLKPQIVQFNITATQRLQSQSQMVDICIGCGSAPCATTSSHNDSPKATASGGATSESRGIRSKSWVAAAVVVPIAIFAGLLAMLCCCQRRGFKMRLQLRSKKLQKAIISRPIEKEKDGVLEEQLETRQDLESDQDRCSSKASEAPKISFRMSNSTTAGATQSPRPNSWQDFMNQAFVRRFEQSRVKQPAAVPEFSLVSKERTLPRGTLTTDSPRMSLSAKLLHPKSVNNFPVKRLSRKIKSKSSRSSSNLSISVGRPTDGFGHGRDGPALEDSSVYFVNKGVGHGGGGSSSGPPGWGVIRNSWRNRSRLSWTTTQSPSHSEDPIFEEKFERPPTQKSFASMISTFPRPLTATTVDKSTRPQVIHEVSDDETALVASSGVPFALQNPQRAKSGSSLRKKGSIRNAALQDFHKRRLQKGASRNPLFGARHSSSRRPSLQIGGKLRERRSNDDPVLIPATPPNPAISRSYSQSSSLEPPSSNSSSARSERSVSSPYGKKSRINYHLTTRVLSPLRRSRSSYASTTGSSKFSDPVGIAGLYPSGALREDTDEEGNKRWRHPAHPNPLGTHATRSANNTDVTDSELIESLRAAGNFDAAQRLDYLRTQVAGNTAAGAKVDPEVAVRSARGRKLDHQIGMKSGDSGNKSFRGDIGDAGGSAFM